MAASSMDKIVGFGFIGIAATIFIYYTLWVMVTPFLHAEAAIQRFFPDRVYALLLPMVAAVLLLFMGGLFVIYVKFTTKEKPKQS